MNFHHIGCKTIVIRDGGRSFVLIVSEKNRFWAWSYCQRKWVWWVAEGVVLDILEALCLGRWHQCPKYVKGVGSSFLIMLSYYSEYSKFFYNNK